MSTRLSESGLWEKQRALYHESGVAAWNTDTVPHYVTNNPIIGAAYADIFVGHLEDLARQGALEPDLPICIVELGGGSGRLAFYILRRLDQLRHNLKFDLRYVLTDFTTTNLKAWAAHPRLAGYLRSGRLDLALFNVETDRELVLQNSGLKLDGSGNPVFCIANYVFDSISADCFRVEKGVLQEALVTVGRDSEDRTTLEYSYCNCQDTPYANPAYNRILEDYTDTLGDTHFLFPTGPLRCLENLLELGGGRVCLLAADKGQSSWDSLIGMDPPHPVVHGTEFFSLTVNFHAMEKYWRGLGGHVQYTSLRDDVLDICCFAIGLPEEALERTTREFADKLDRFGPLDYLNLRTALLEGTFPPARYFRFCLEMLRLSQWDPEILYELSESLMTSSENLNPKEQRELVLALNRSWDNYFPIGESRDLPFELARLFFRLEHYDQARQFYQESIRLFGGHKMTYHNMGMCYYRLYQLDAAISCFQEALKLDPGHGPSRDWLLRLDWEKQPRLSRDPAGNTQIQTQL